MSSFIDKEIHDMIIADDKYFREKYPHRYENDFISEERKRELDKISSEIKLEEVLFHKEFSLGDKKYLLKKLNDFNEDEAEELIKTAIREERKRKLKKAKREIKQKAQELYGEIDNKKREIIPDDVKEIVWQRDKGQCVQCGSNEKLEFDHIIPVSKGGSGTARNIQLLCEKCNREKSSNI